MLALVSQQSLAAESATITYVNSIPDNAKIVDVREVSECKKSTLLSATCLSVEDLMASRQRLANFSGLLWKLGTIGLTGSEHVLVVGNNVARKDTVAGILHLAGQSKISILDLSISELTDSKSTWSFSKGIIAPSTRTQVWQRPMRSDRIVLHNEMMQIVFAENSLILDGRSDAEYWGQVVKAHRGGHIPGADSSSYTHWIDSPGSNGNGTPSDVISTEQTIVVYAADTYSGISYYTRAIAAGLTAHVYLDGWVRWAAHADLTVDAASYSSENISRSGTKQSKSDMSLRQHLSQNTLSWILWGLSVAIAFISGYIISRISQRKSQ